MEQDRRDEGERDNDDGRHEEGGAGEADAWNGVSARKGEPDDRQDQERTHEDHDAEGQRDDAVDGCRQSRVAATELEGEGGEIGADVPDDDRRLQHERQSGREIEARLPEQPAVVEHNEKPHATPEERRVIFGEAGEAEEQRTEH
jgi:hypothetical protein